MGMSQIASRPARRWRVPEQRERAAKISRGFAHIHAKFGGDHFVAAAAGVQLRAERAELFNQRGFDEMMNVFGLRSIEPRGIGSARATRFHRAPWRFAGLLRRVRIPAAAMARAQARSSASSCGSMRRSKLPGALEFVERCVGAAFEAAAPHLLFAGSGHQALAFCGFSWLGQRRFQRHGDGQREKIDEAFGVLGVVAGHGEAGEIGAIERIGRVARGDVDVAFEKRERDRAGDAALRAGEKRVESFAQRREPHAVINHLGVAQAREAAGSARFRGRAQAIRARDAR